MSSLGSRLFRLWRRDLEDAKAEMAPRRAWVAEEADGQVRLAWSPGGTPGKRWHARAAGTAPSVGDEVMAIPIGSGTYFVVPVEPA